MVKQVHEQCGMLQYNTRTDFNINLHYISLRYHPQMQQLRKHLVSIQLNAFRPS